MVTTSAVITNTAMAMGMVRVITHHSISVDLTINVSIWAVLSAQQRSESNISMVLYTMYLF